MPIESSIDFTPVEQDRFHAVDREVMRHAFDIHNTLGRFCDERIYQEELAQRCRESNFEVHREVRLHVLHQDFRKSYYLDMLVRRGVIYEMKAAATLNKSHQKQLINYLLLAHLNHGKLVNLRPESVESRFVSTSLSRKDRSLFQLSDSKWQDDDEPSRRLRDTLCALLDDWGAFLDVSLYREAMLHLMNGPESGIHSVDIEVEGRTVGTQKMCLLTPNTAWHLSAIRQHLRSYETHIVRMFNHTPLEKMHWINIDQRTVAFKTLRK